MSSLVSLYKETSKSFFCEVEITAHLLLRIGHGSPPSTSLFGNPDDFVDTLRSRVGIDLSRRAYFGQKLQEAIEWTASRGQGVAAKLGAGFTRLGAHRAVFVDRSHVRVREAVPPFIVHQFALRGDVACFGAERL
jgi:hypothetical protein